MTRKELDGHAVWSGVRRCWWSLPTATAREITRAVEAQKWTEAAQLVDAAAGKAYDENDDDAVRHLTVTGNIIAEIMENEHEK